MPVVTRVTLQTLNKSYGKDRRKRCVFRRPRKTDRDDADVTWRGRSFQVRAAATGKAQSLTVDSRGGLDRPGDSSENVPWSP